MNVQSEVNNLLQLAPPSDTIDEYEQQIKQLQQKLSQNEDERTLLRERLNEVELEVNKVTEDRASTLAMYEDQLQSVIQERNAFVEQQTAYSSDK